MRKMLISIAFVAGLSDIGNPVLAAAQDRDGDTSTTAETADSGQNPAPGQIIALEGEQNFRDIGGYATLDGRRVRRGLIFRSADLHDLSDDDHERRQAILVDVVQAFGRVEGRHLRAAVPASTANMAGSRPISNAGWG